MFKKQEGKDKHNVQLDGYIIPNTKFVIHTHTSLSSPFFVLLLSLKIDFACLFVGWLAELFGNNEKIIMKSE